METKHVLDRGSTWAELLRYAAPNMLMMVLLSLYTIVDGMFVGQCLGAVALSSMNMVMPVFSFIVGITLMLSIGGGAVCARLMGEGESLRAKQTFTMLVLVMLCFAILVTGLALIYIEELLTLLGCTSMQMPLSMEYMRYIGYFAPAFVLQTAFQVYFVTAGKPIWGLVLTAMSGGLNIVLDYVFLVEMQMDIAGASIATGIAASLSALGGLLYFSCARGSHLCFVRPRLSLRQLGSISVNGSSEMVTHISAGVTTWLLNVACLRFYGEMGVAAITIILYMQFLFSSFFFGYAEGVAPVISYHYGAKNTQMLKTVYRNNMRVIIALSVIVFLISQLSISSIVGFFTMDAEGGAVAQLTEHAFSIYVYAFLIMAVNVYASAHFTALGNGLISGLLAFTRTFVCLAGCILLLPEFFGANGIWLSVPLAECIGLVMALYLLHYYKKRYQY